MDNIKTINKFFSTHYDKLVRVSGDYTKRYNYHLLTPDEIISELYMYIVDKETRMNKICELINKNGYTYKYNYNNEALYYIIKIIYNVTARKRMINGNKQNRQPDIIYVDEIYFKNDDITFPIEEDYKITYKDFTVEEVLNASIEIIFKGNWYKEKLWYDYHFKGIKYKELSKKYSLTISSLYDIVQDFNQQVVEYLMNKKK